MTVQWPVRQPRLPSLVGLVPYYDMQEVPEACRQVIMPVAQRVMMRIGLPSRRIITIIDRVYYA